MQANQRSLNRKTPKFLDIKILIATLSAAVTIGLWNLFANQALVEAAQEDLNADQPDQPEESQTLLEDPSGLPPVPTLIPMMNLSESVPAVRNTVQGQPSASLRSVAAPTLSVVQKNKPQIDAPVVVVVGGGRSRGSSPAATTRSSH